LLRAGRAHTILLAGVAAKTAPLQRERFYSN